MTVSFIDWSSSNGDLAGCLEDGTLKAVYSDSYGRSWNIYCHGVVAVLRVKHYLQVELVHGAQHVLVSQADIEARGLRVKPVTPVVGTPPLGEQTFDQMVGELNALLEQKWHPASFTDGYSGEPREEFAHWSMRGSASFQVQLHKDRRDGSTWVVSLCDESDGNQYRGDISVRHEKVGGDVCGAVKRMLSLL